MKFHRNEVLFKAMWYIACGILVFSMIIILICGTDVIEKVKCILFILIEGILGWGFTYLIYRFSTNYDLIEIDQNGVTVTERKRSFHWEWKSISKVVTSKGYRGRILTIYHFSGEGTTVPFDRKLKEYIMQYHPNVTGDL